jgi:hypothetical protein
MTEHEILQSIAQNIFLLQEMSSLKTVSQTLRIKYKEREDFLGQLQTVSLKVGDSVQLKQEYQNGELRGEVGKIQKINPKKIKVAFGLKIWNIPKVMLEKA